MFILKNRNDGWLRKFLTMDEAYQFWSSLIATWNYDLFEETASGQQHMICVSEKDKMGLSRDTLKKTVDHFELQG